MKLLRKYDTSPYISSYSIFMYCCEDGFFRFNDPHQIRALCNRNLALMSPGSAVFVVTEELNCFWSQLNSIDIPLVLIIGRSDETIDARFTPIFNHPNIIHTFAQNCVVSHPKVTKLPLGLGNRGWRSVANPITNFDIFSSANRDGVHELGLIDKLFVSFNIDHSPAKRMAAFRYMQSLPASKVTFHTFPSLHSHHSQYNYYREAKRHQFIVCPHGNGIDTHRLWQSLYLGCIPITLESPAYDPAIGSGLIQVSQWNDIDSIDLKYLYNSLVAQRNLIKLKLSYWVDLIKSKKTCLLA